MERRIPARYDGAAARPGACAESARFRARVVTDAGTLAAMADLHGERVVLRPLEAAHGPELRRILATPQVAAWWGPPEHDFPESDDPDCTRFTVLIDGAVAGLVQYLEADDPDARSADIDLFLDPRHHGRGLGTDALRTIARHLLEERGHHRLTIVPQAANAAAIRSYEKAGFRAVGVTRLSFRDPTGTWRDELFMELVVAPRAAPPEDGVDQPAEGAAQSAAGEPRSATAR
jgi:aminoglycoside 6'-N-acetyltransferase